MSLVSKSTVLYSLCNTWGDTTANGNQSQPVGGRADLKRLFAILCLTGLVGCTEVDIPILQPTDVVSSAAILGGDLVVAGPSGFCIDQNLSDTAQRFVVLGGCDVLSRGRAIGPGVKAVLTVSVSADRSADVAKQSHLKRALGNPAALDTMSAEGAYLIQIAGGGDRYLPDGDPVYWQGITTVNGYLVMMTALSEPGGVATKRAGGNLLLNLAQRIRLGSPDRILPKPPKLRPSGLGETRIAGL